MPVLLLVTPAQAATNAALWHMESLPTMTDSSGNGNNGTASAGVTTVAGTNGNGYHFSGTGHVTVPSSDSLNPGSADFSVTAHVNFPQGPSSTTGDFDLIRKGLTTAPGGEWKMEIFPNSSLSSPAYCLFKDANKVTASIRGTKNLAGTGWHTITCTKTSTQIKLTVDGATQTKTVSLGSIGNTADLVVGQKLGGGDQYAGDMDEVSIDIGSSTGEDRTPPTVTARAPAAGDTGVATTTNVTATFSEDVQPPTSSTFKLKVAGTSTALPATVTYDPSTMTATLQPSAALKAATKYTATLTAGIKDLAGNPLTATSWSFTTAAGSGDITPPTVTAKTPAAGATNVPATTNVTATFSEDVQPPTSSTFKLKISGTTKVVTATVTYDPSTRTATLHPNAALNAGTKYAATLTAGNKDLAGNALKSTSWSFTVAP